MKKVLYSTTALAAAGMFAFSGSSAEAQMAEKVKIGVSGSYIALAGFSDNDGELHKNLDAFNLVGDSEVNFRGNTTLDNGVRVDVIIDLETDQSNSNNGTVIDESYIKVGNMKQWGEFRFGSTKQAHFLFKVNAPAVNTISNALNNDQGDRFLPAPSWNNSEDDKHTATKFFNHAGGADRMKAVYITPNLSGFQGGISYTPAQANSDGPADTGGNNPADGSNVSVGGNYKGKFGDVGVGVSGGYTMHDGPGTAESTIMQFGASLSFAGFTVGGGWAEQEDGKAMSTAADREGFMLGAGYKTGPWSVALTWLNTTDDVDPDAPGEDESNQYTLGAAYSLGAGVTVGASLVMADYADETPDPMKNNEGWALISGMKVAF